MTAIDLALLVAGALVALPGAVAVLHLTAMTVASLFHRAPPERQPARTRFLVLIPAHDEESVLARTLEALRGELREGDRVLVVADHCTDGTIGIARAAGAEVLELSGDAPSGRAAARQQGLEFAGRWSWDAVAFIDADSIVEPGFLAACETMLGHTDALQARSEAALEPGLLAQATLAAFALQGVTLPRGRDRLGLAVRLRGTGMVLRRHVAERTRFRAPASEDLFYTIDLARQGIRIRHADAARLRSQSTTSLRAASTQRVRWESGRIAAAVTEARGLLRWDRACLDLALHLLTPPFALAVLSLVVGSALLLVGGHVGLAAVAWGLLVLFAADLGVALAAVRAPLRTWAALGAAPWYVLWKAVVQVRAVVGVARGRQSFPATPRGTS